MKTLIHGKNFINNLIVDVDIDKINIFRNNKDEEELFSTDNLLLAEKFLEYYSDFQKLTYSEFKLLFPEEIYSKYSDHYNKSVQEMYISLVGDIE